MNVLYIHTHDSGRCFAPYGYPVSTPAISRFAREGTLFRQAFSAAPVCSPSRASLLTGKSPHACGMLGLAHRGFGLDNYGEHVANLLKAESMETVLCGIQHVAHSPEIIGYDHILGETSFGMGDDFHQLDSVSYDLANAGSVADYLSARSNDDGEFFLSFGMFNTHRPYPPTPEGSGAYVLPPVTVRDTPESREDFAGHIAAVEIVDQAFSIVVTALEKAGLRERTLVIFTTDHGMPFPDMKCSLFDGGTGVALIIDYPGNASKGKVVDALVSHLDILPTICELTDTTTPDYCEGSSLVPLCDGTRERIREEVFGEVSYHAAYEPMRSIRTSRYKLIKRYDVNLDPVPANIDDSPAKKRLLDAGYLRFPRTREMLIDLDLDPLERENRIHDPAYREVYRELNESLAEWMRRTGDPLYLGRVPKPAGALVNRAECISAEESLFE